MTHYTEAFHVGEHIREEMDARGWDQWELAERMGNKPAENFLALDLLTLEDPNMILGYDMAYRLANAFGTGVELWMNLDESWRTHPTTPQCDEQSTKRGD